MTSDLIEHSLLGSIQVITSQSLVIFFLFELGLHSPFREDVVMSVQRPFDYTHRVDLSAMQAIHGIRTIGELNKMIAANKKQVNQAKHPNELNALWCEQAGLIRRLDLIEQ